MAFVMSSYFSIWFCMLYVSVYVQAVAGHGFVHNVVVGGQNYPGWNPFSDPFNNPSPRAVRKVGSDGFVADSDADLACHHGGDAGTTAIAEAPAGSKVTFQWAYWPGDHQGPVSTYMTSCNGDCSTFSAKNAKWFKIDAAGYFPDDRQWAADKLRADGNSWTSTIPNNLAPGQYYLVDIHATYDSSVALHSITPQCYPSCIQIKVTGKGTGLPSAGDLMTMQEIYSGVKWPNIYLSPDLASFVVPGPPPPRLDGTGNTPKPTTSSAISATSTRTETRTSAPTSRPTSQPSGQCVLTPRRLIRRPLVQ